ncbi:uncharacterized protein FIBRA_05285 [Fibroporia radiculosa]|uniref:Golgi-body localization protein domain-containing protein n=1 Tax=Fibroporia radiculosa TaxID=599839 RepID=J4G8Z9_9APHY|nr:uncharacterized protein FIBRA_05285 [Fibroporia radiculosa]CCM03163.1 predicted protein [Fibroporia radiculosa]
MVLTYVFSVLRTLVLASPTDYSLWAVFILWAVRLISLSLIFRIYVGPSIIRLISKRLRVRSVSLRSIRGIYFRAGSGTLRVDRIGISYHRPSAEIARRFSIVVEGVKVELDRRKDNTRLEPSFSRKRSGSPSFTFSPLVRRSWPAIWSVLRILYAVLEPYVRPVVRSLFVSILRLVIRALPAITHVLDFELHSAVVTLADVPGLELSVRQAKLYTTITLSSIDGVIIPGTRRHAHHTRRHKSLANVADWNARIAGSLRRTWDRAWGATQVTASLTLGIKHITGTASSVSLQNLPKASATGEYHPFYVYGMAFVDVPSTTFTALVRIDPHRAIEPHSVETSLKLDTVDIKIDAIQRLLKLLRSRPRQQSLSELNEQLPLSPASMQTPLSASLSPPLPNRRFPWPSPMSPGSPLMEALSSASMRLGWGHKHIPVRRLGSKAVSSHLSFLKAVNIIITKLQLQHGPQLNERDVSQTFVATLRGIDLHVGLSHPGSNPIHRKMLGTGSVPDDDLGADVYRLNLSTNRISLDRSGSGAIVDHLQVLSIGSLQVDAMISQWPSPWLCSPRFLSGDPNSQLLAVNIDLGEVRLTERLEVLRVILARQQPPAEPTDGRAPLPSILSPVPRIAFGFKVGPVIARLISSGVQTNEDPFALEARTDGLVLALDSHYLSLPDKRSTHALHDHLNLKMEFFLNCSLQRTSIHLQFGSELSSRHERGSPAEFSHHSGDGLLNLDTFEIIGHGNGIGDIAEEGNCAITLDVPSLFTDLRCSTEAISIELWQPSVLKAISRLSAYFIKGTKKPEHTSARYVLDSLPFGLSASISVGRFVVFVTAPDLAPGEELGITRGVAAHLGFSLRYCAVHNRHYDRISNLLARSQKRLRLALPTEHIVQAVAGTTTPVQTPSPRALIGIALWDVALRDAVATPFTADDPYCHAEQDVNLTSKEFLRIANVDIDMVLSGLRPNGTYRPGSKDDLLITAAVSRIRGSLRLAHIYHLLLAVETLKGLLPPSSSEKRSAPTHSTLSLSLQCDIKEAQLLFEFPLRSKLYLQISYLCCTGSPLKKITLKWSSIILAIAVSTIRDGSPREEWEELARLSDWSISLPLHINPTSILVEGNSGRLRIPFDFVLADLILDVNLTVKSAKHLIRMVSDGQYSKPPVPEAEDAKIVPNISITIRCLTIDAADENLESRMGLIWRTGYEAARLRQERDEAFQAKVSTILTSNYAHPQPHDVDSDFQFGSKHTVSISNARERLYQVHSVAWKSSFMKANSLQKSREDKYTRHAIGRRSKEDLYHDLVSVNPMQAIPPLLRISWDSLILNLSAPKTLIDNIPELLFSAGDGLPKDTQFSLLVPLHINFTVASLRMTFREYPLPLLNIPPNSIIGSPALEFDTNLVIAEEMGTDCSVEWFPCEVVHANSGIHGAPALSIPVPKTIMPVKTYAQPTIRVLTDGTTDLAWAVSYGPATQDFMRVIDTLSHAPRDPSPPIGFWDKLRLILHWRVKVFFKGDVQFNMKGSRDPYGLSGDGAGFALSWRGDPCVFIGQPNEQGELIQVKSDTMLIIIPNVQETWGQNGEVDEPTLRHSISATPFSTFNPRRSRESRVCAKVSSGTCFGVGFVLERSCGSECGTCTGKPFDRECRFFDFLPHYKVKLETKAGIPEPKSFEDSYNGFRSDFIHMSISLTSGLRNGGGRHKVAPSSLHLSPEVFEHFWAWYALFDGALSLPIRQGSLYSRKRPVSPKFGQHLATLKYRVLIEQFFITHLYVDNSCDAWADGVTPFVGVKALIDRFQVDMHQRDQESSRLVHGEPKAVHHKAFYAIEVVMKGLDLRSMLAVFSEPLKQEVRMESSPLVSNYRSEIKTDSVSQESEWIDCDDFDRNQWSPDKAPTVYLQPVGYCPHFTYFKRATDENAENPENVPVRSKFGAEKTHICHLGQEASVTQVQISLTGSRIKELQQKLAHCSAKASTSNDGDENELRKKIALLNNYVQHLHKIDATSFSAVPQRIQSYHMPSDAVSPEDWAEFDHVYQVHSPQIYLNRTIRDVMMQYYYCSRAKRGIEYHMATRAVKFIRDQAQAALADLVQDKDGHRKPVSNAQAAAIAVRNFFTGENTSSTPVDDGQPYSVDDPGSIDPLDGWSEDVSLQKSHFCLLLKPQFVLRSEANSESDHDSVCVLAAVQGKLTSFAILDSANADDPVSGLVMNRNFASIVGLQTFSPSTANMSGDGYVPLEVLIDLRCENSAFDRLVPQTNALFQYDKFNRLRLRNDVTSVAQTGQNSNRQHDHLQNQTDLVRVHVPRFTVSANDGHFQAIANIVTRLILFSDAALKDRSDKLERMLFNYDFTNLASAADVVANMQIRLRHALETRQEAVRQLHQYGNEGQVEILRIDAHIILLAEELNLIFDAIKLAQDKANDHPEQKSALLLHTSSSEISWRMLDQQGQLLAKLAVRDINFYWLSRQDSSIVNQLVLGDLQAFDGAADAEWTEILSKHTDPITHPLVKRKLFVVADWIVLPPVGGITIYERFELTFHPMRLQLDTRTGRRIMEYVWPARRHREHSDDELHGLDSLPDSPSPTSDHANILIIPDSPLSPRRSSWDVSPLKSPDASKLTPVPLRKLGTSRSFTDLRNASRSDTLRSPGLHKTRSTDALVTLSKPSRSVTSQVSKDSEGTKERNGQSRKRHEIDDATEMKTRSSQKTFVWVRVNSLYLLLSIAKEDSFLCRDARIRTRDLEYRNQTWSFEELVDQFIPSGRNWRGWVKMAFQQPLVPVLPVARELISKTKWIAPKSHHSHTLDEHHRSTLLPFQARQMTSSSSSGSTATGSRTTSTPTGTLLSSSKGRAMSLFHLHNKTATPIVASSLTTEPEEIQDSSDASSRRRGRPRVFSVFKRRNQTGMRSSMDSDMSTTSVGSSRPSEQSSREDSNANGDA